MVKPYKKAQLFNAKGDLSARWFVYFSYQHPATGKFERIKVYKDINTYKTKAERNEHASLLIQGINQALDAGYNPFLKTNEQRFGDVHTLAQAIPAYLAVKESLRDKTVTGYRSILNLFLTWATSRGLHTYELKHLKRKDIQEYFTNALKTRNLAATTHNTELTTIRGFFTFWQDEGLVVANPAKGIKRLKEEIGNHSIYSDGQIEVITTYLKESDTPRATQLLHYIRFLYYACIRPKELRMLQVKDIRLDTSTILIPSSVSKSGRAEPVDISPGLMDVIKDMKLKGIDPEWYVFGNQGKGVPGNYSDPKPGPKPVGINYFTDYYREILKTLGFSDDHTLYAWKHTRNVHLYMQDKDLLRLMRHNRHTDPKVTMRYLRSLGLLLDSRLDDERRI